MGHQGADADRHGFSRRAKRAMQASLGALLLAGAGQALPAQDSVRGVDIANPLVGTAPLDRQDLIGNAPPPGEPVYSGQTSPGARLPHSSVEAAPMNNNIALTYPNGVPTPYYYTNPTMIGFTGGGGQTYGGNAEPIIMPVVGDWSAAPAYNQAYYDKKREIAAPGYYSVYLDSFRTQVELTGTRWASLMQFSFPQSARSNILLNLLDHGGSVEVVDDHTIRGISKGRESIDGRYFVAEFSRPFAQLGTFRRAPGDNKGWGIGDKDVVPAGRSIEGDYAGAYVTYQTKAGDKVLVRMAHGTSYEQATQRLRQELPNWDFAAVRSAARGTWDKLLGRVQVSGGTAKQRALFYSTLFQSFASPRLIAQKGEPFTDSNGKVQVATHDRYGPVPFWDTGRNQIVLLALMEPEVVQDIMQSEYEMAQEKGYMNTSFHGDNAVFLYLGAWKRGIPFDYAGVWTYLRKNATDPRGPRGYLAEYDRQGWIADIVPQGNPSPPYAGGKAGAATTMEYAWDDHALADYAGRLGKGEDQRRFLKRAGNYANVFDRSTGFVRGRTADGKWIAPFDQQEPYYNFMMKEASGWSTLWLAPHDVKGLMTLLGGREAFNAKLDQFFATPYAPTGICRDCTGLIGQYVHGNQPDQQVPYYYDWSGQPWKTQALVRRILDEMYGSDAAGYGYAGMDDQGATSSWYVMSAMGFYPVDPSSDVYMIGSPVFDHVRLEMGGGKALEIEAKNNGAANIYIQSMTLNGKPWTRPWFRHADIKDGARIAFVMGNKPNPKWGSAPADTAPSMSDATR
ncbi:GH92 family glycosyl hydrolase [Sphingobium sp. AP49]|uniref:GH92 family glycosyl hydrolase n=1 Tax=Sphingobium sp. AP49 TaxID=1144307 RepID=UPI00026ECF60|nr:GH92 family glycosyl hydrolase [Sphingobium sp. AP49]WHO39862.1 GH92 family glycosyl hydrolase [Sphingobium sp. AP49]